jgi:cobalamin-dependent methionine synthase I
LGRRDQGIGPERAPQALYTYLDQRYQLARTASIHPGSLQDWPIQEQGPLFAQLGEAAPAIGVQLTPSYLMVPTKSVSGIRFPLEESFESCQLCTRQNCPNRRAPYEEGLYERKYRRAG